MSFHPSDCHGDSVPGPAGDLIDDVAWRTFIASAQEQGPWPLSDEHWQVVRYVLAYFKENGEAPALVRVSRFTRIGSKRLFKLFPFGPVRTIFQMAGLPLPVDMIGCCPPLSLLESN